MQRDSRHDDPMHEAPAPAVPASGAGTIATPATSAAARTRGEPAPAGADDAADARAAIRARGDVDAETRLEGRRVPHCVFRMRWGGSMADVASEALFEGKRVVLFGLPGAFTPTCSSAHVPRFAELAPFLRRHGIDDVVCIAVNDAHVMEAWQRDQKAEGITFVPDGNGDFHRALGLLVDKRHEGMGVRARRYAMIVDDGTIVTALVEPDTPGDPYEVSSADDVCKVLGLGTATPADIVLFTRPGCGYSEKAKQRLDRAGMPYEAVDLHPRGIRAVSGETTTPQIFVDGARIGGFEALEQWLAEDASRAAAS